MIKFSVIITIYNSEKFLKRAIESVLKQDYTAFELLLVNDGSTDSSSAIMEEYAKKEERIKLFNKKNTGIADTRNFAISKCRGEYFLFLDDDDTLNDSLLTHLDEEIKKFPAIDLVKYQIQKIVGDDVSLEKTNLFSHLSGEDAFSKLISNSLFVTPVSYAYRREYFINGKFSYASGRVHEDFGLTPLLVIKAKNVSAISYVGYNYFVRENSIMTTNSLDKLQKKNDDMLAHYDYLLACISKEKILTKTSIRLFKSYISNALISRCSLLSKDMLEDYITKLKQKRIYQNLLVDTLPRRMKKLLFRFFPMFYVKLFCK